LNVFVRFKLSSVFGMIAEHVRIVTEESDSSGKVFRMVLDNF
jgi:hypothetical protein